MFYAQQEPPRQRGLRYVLVGLGVVAVIGFVGLEVRDAFRSPAISVPRNVDDLPTRDAAVPTGARVTNTPAPVASGQSSARPTATTQPTQPPLSTPRATIAPTSSVPRPTPVGKLTPEDEQAMQGLVAYAAAIAGSRSAEAEIRALPMPSDVSNVVSDGAHVLTYRAKSTGIEVIDWYTAKLEAAHYTVTVQELPESVPIRAIKFTTPGGREGTLVAGVGSPGNGVQVQVVIR